MLNIVVGIVVSIGVVGIAVVVIVGNSLLKTTATTATLAATDVQQHKDQVEPEEILERRHAFVRRQETQRRAFRERTSLKVYPLQAMAMQDCDELLREHRAGNDGGNGGHCPEDTEDPQRKCPLVGDVVVAPDFAHPRHKYQYRDIATAESPLSSSTSSLDHDDDEHDDDDAPRQRLAGEEEDCGRPQERVMATCCSNGKQSESVRSPSPSSSLSSSLWSNEPRLFAMETTVGGRRRYISAHLGRFMDRYWREYDVDTRHYYELIREGAPCRLYFDLEFAKGPNAQLTPAITECLLDELFDELVREFHIVYDNIEMPTIDRSYLVDLDSSTSTKFSRHWILHLPNGMLFPDARYAGAFVRKLVSRLELERESGELRARGRGLLADNLLVYVNDDDDTDDDVGEERRKTRRTTYFIDLGVYTRNRIFRLLGSTKFGKPADAALRIADANRYPFPLGFDNTKFYKPEMIGCRRHDSNNNTNGRVENVEFNDDDDDFEAFCNSLSWEDHADAMAATLIVPVDASRMNYPILIDPDNHSCNYGLGPRSGLDGATSLRASLSHGASPFPKLQSWIVSTLGRREGLVGAVGTWSIGTQRPLPRTVCFNMMYNRYCDNVRRAHKSNNIIWNVDLGDRVCYQGCHDPECRGFRGKFIDLPEDVNGEIDEYFLEYELSSLNEDDVVRNKENRQTLHNGDDGVFDDLFLEAAMLELDLTSICQQKVSMYESSSTGMSKLCSDLRKLNVSINTSSPEPGNVRVDCSFVIRDTSAMSEPLADSDNDLDLELAKLNLSDIVEKNKS